MGTIDTYESNAVSWIRVLAMTSIVACHVLQYYGNHWAWVLNVGVQVFLVMSGFLYGHKVIDDWKKWFTRRILKIYVPFILFAIIMLLSYKEFSATDVKPKNFIVYSLALQGMWGG